MLADEMTVVVTIIITEVVRRVLTLPRSGEDDQTFFSSSELGSDTKSG